MCILSAEHTAPLPGQARASTAADASNQTPTASTSTSVPESLPNADGLAASGSPRTPKGKKRKREDKREPPAWFQDYSNKSLRLQEAMVEESKLKNELLKQLLEKL